MTVPLELKGMLAGKRIMVTSGKGGPSTVPQLRDYLRRYQCSDTLRILGSAGEQVDEDARACPSAAAPLRWRLESARSGIGVLESLSEVRTVERLIVSYDEISWTNWILRDVAREVSGVPDNFHAHFASVHDLERMLAHCWEGSLFDLLERKRVGNSDQAEMDFQDWLTVELDPSGEARNPLLERKLDETFKAWGLESPAQLSAVRSAPD